MARFGTTAIEIDWRIPLDSLIAFNESLRFTHKYNVHFPNYLNYKMPDFNKTINDLKVINTVFEEADLRHSALELNTGKRKKLNNSQVNFILSFFFALFSL